MTQHTELSNRCTNCGATLHFKPGTDHLACQYCKAENQIVSEKPTQITEFDINAYEAEVFNHQEKFQTTVVTCHTCSAETTLGNKLASKDCPFCGTPLVLKLSQVKRLHKPHYLLPFLIEKQQASIVFQTWLKTLWFAPSALKHSAIFTEKLKGIYLPFWTYDCQATTTYTGEQGIEYSERVEDENGDYHSETRVRWHPVSNKISITFDDILVPGSKSLPENKIKALEPWDLKQLKPYDAKYLTGFETENYQITLREGYTDAKKQMEAIIRNHIRSDIGGDRQRIHQLNTSHSNVTFKHILLPAWVSAYRYRGKVYQFIVNARTAEVQGERPYSLVKISLILFLISAILIALMNDNWAVVLQSIESYWANLKDQF